MTLDQFSNKMLAGLANLNCFTFEQQWFHGGNTIQHLQVFLQGVLDCPIEHHLQLRHTALQLNSGHRGIFHHLPPKNGLQCVVFFLGLSLFVGDVTRSIDDLAYPIALRSPLMHSRFMNICSRRYCATL
jgi:hypothetical protein